MMESQGQKNKELLIKLNTEDLTSTQVRLIKSVNALLAHVLTAEDEAEFFDNSAELLRKTAEIIKHAEFAIKNTQMNYGDQAVEYAIDFLNESFDQNKIQNIDN